MQNKNTVYIVIGFIVVAGLAFYGGMKYGSSSSVSTQVAGGGQGRSGGLGGGNGARGQNGGFVSGNVIAKDATSFTVQLPNSQVTDPTVQNGSKIIFFSPTTQVGKSVDGTSTDIIVGKNVTVTGTSNSDGSITAKSVQIRNTMPVAPKQ